MTWSYVGRFSHDMIILRQREMWTYISETCVRLFLLVCLYMTYSFSTLRYILFNFVAVNLFKMCTSILCLLASFSFHKCYVFSPNLVVTYMICIHWFVVYSTLWKPDKYGHFSRGVVHIRCHLSCHSFNC